MSVDPAILAEVPFFAALGAEERAALAARLDIRTETAGHALFAYGDPGDSLYILRGGEVEIFATNDMGDRVVLETLRAGDHFGELSLLDGGPRTASAVVKQDMRAVVVDRDDLGELLRLHPGAAIHLLAASGRRLRENAEYLRHSASRDVNEEQHDHRTTAMKVADWIGWSSSSIPFLLLHCVLFLAWIVLNVGPLSRTWLGGWDPFPFGLLAIAVSIEAILLTLFVLLSQGRQTAREHVRNAIEHRVNVKTELEIGYMHEKLDSLRAEMLRRFAEVQSALNTRSPKA